MRANDHYVKKVADPLAPDKFVKKINVPTFLACQFTDEQTGGHCASLPKHFTGTKRKWFTFTNGNHIDSLDPATFTRWYDFLELYVAHRRPHLSDSLRAAAPVVFKSAMGVEGVNLPDDPIQAQPTYDGGARRVPGAAAGADPVRQRRRQRPVQARRELRALVLALPAAGDDRALVVPRGGRRARRRQAGRGGDRHVQVEPRGAAGDELHRQHRQRHERAVDGDARRTSGRRTRPAPRRRT